MTKKHDESKYESAIGQSNLVQAEVRRGEQEQERAGRITEAGDNEEAQRSIKQN